MSEQKTYWKGFEDLKKHPLVEPLKQREFTKKLPIDLSKEDKFESIEKTLSSRRDFLKLMGFSTAAATLAACEGPVKNVIPYVVRPVSIIPGVANYYASTYYDGNDFASILVKTREGRPIKIEPNKQNKKGFVPNTRVQGSLLNLYDNHVYKTPEEKGKVITWKNADKLVLEELNRASKGGKKIVLLTSKIISPTSKKLFDSFKDKYPTFSVVEYNSMANEGAVKAYNKIFGIDGLPSYDFKQADLIVSFGADFLGDWYGGNVSKSYAKKRNPDKDLSRHIQLESNMSLTGANADRRILMNSVEQGKALADIYGYLVGKKSDKGTISLLMKEIKAAGNKALIISGSSDKYTQMIVYAINLLLDSKAFKWRRPQNLGAVSYDGIRNLVEELKQNKIGVLFTHLTNPVYSLPEGNEFKNLLKKITHISFARNKNETSINSRLNLPANHVLESWSDSEPIPGVYTLGQPTISPLFDTKQVEENFLRWMGSPESFYQRLKSNWNDSILSEKSWNLALHDGYYLKEPQKYIEILDTDVSIAIDVLKKKKSKGTELHLYSKIGMGDGTQANNPWLQEFPDPISRATWDNYLTISKRQADELNLENFIDEDIMETNGAINSSLVNLRLNGKIIENVPVLIQPGQAYGTVGLALGYGRTNAGKMSQIQKKPIGVNAFSLYQDFSSVQSSVVIEKVKGEHKFAFLQLHSTMMGRDIVKETTQEIYKQGKGDVDIFNHPHYMETINGKEPIADIDLWQNHDRSIGLHFNLSIDLNKCTGCGACVLACQVENNIPVVGKEEVRMYRDMHWIRIDRYYSSESSFLQDLELKNNNPENLSFKSLNKKLEDPSRAPEVVFQPVMCQHCNHAPCETVCPVAATSHGKQGQNQMAYNRCIGTRYCANNCPYKVRRFNWFLYAENDKFDYNMNDDLGRMVLNPDVVVRSRGVMEKCSMCIQMTQMSILRAKKEGRKLKDGELKTACSVACPSEAIEFGDINDNESKISKLYNSKKNKRKYYLLEAVGTKPNVFYNLKVRNKKS